MTWGIVAGAAVSIGGSLIGSNAAKKGAKAQAESAEAANELQKYQYDTTREDNMPMLEARNNALSQYQNLLPSLTQTFDGSSVASDPGYQFGLRQGQNALDNSALNRGGLYSGAQMKATQQFGNDYGSTKFNDAFNRNLASRNFTANQYQSLMGAGQSGVNQINAAGQNYANQAGNNLTSAGAARAAGYVGSANAIGNGISQGFNMYQNNQLLSMLRPQNAAVSAGSGYNAGAFSNGADYWGGQ